jgi:hypothetical protein
VRHTVRIHICSTAEVPSNESGIRVTSFKEVPTTFNINLVIWSRGHISFSEVIKYCPSYGDLINLYNWAHIACLKHYSQLQNTDLGNNLSTEAPFTLTVNLITVEWNLLNSENCGDHCSCSTGMASLKHNTWDMGSLSLFWYTYIMNIYQLLVSNMS